MPRELAAIKHDIEMTKERLSMLRKDFQFVNNDIIAPHVVKQAVKLLEERLAKTLEEVEAMRSELHFLYQRADAELNTATANMLCIKIEESRNKLTALIAEHNDIIEYRELESKNSDTLKQMQKLAKKLSPEELTEWLKSMASSTPNQGNAPDAEGTSV